MSIWDSYAERIASRGSSKREAALRREQHMLSTKLLETLSCHDVMMDGSFDFDGHLYEYDEVLLSEMKGGFRNIDAEIINSDNLNEKTIYSIDNSLRSGGLISWKDSRWLITECDVNNEVYTKAKMRRCNHLLKWVDSDGMIHEQWCIIEDGTKYLTGEYEDRNFVVTRGDSRIAMTIAKNKNTLKFCRESRFLIDDPDSGIKLSYLLTKPLKVGWVYNADGIYSFVLQEVVSTDDDNHELGIADYYKYFPKNTVRDTSDENNSVGEPDCDIDTEGRQVWL